MILAALALATAPALVETTPTRMYEVAPGIWSDVNEPIKGKPPTPKQAECLAKWDKRDDVLNGIDLATTGIGLAMGLSEVGFAGLFGPAAPAALIVIKLVSRDMKKRALRKTYAAGDYDKLCAMLKVRNAVTAGAIVTTVISAGTM